MAHAAMPEAGGIGNADKESDQIEIGQNRYKDSAVEQGPRHGFFAEAGRQRQRNGRMRENGRHGEMVSD